MAKIEIGRYSEQLRRLLSMAGQELVAPELAPEIVATLQLEADRPEWWFLRGERHFAGSASQNPAAGLFAQFRIRNPSGSGILSVITRVVGANLGAAVQNIELRLGATVGAQAAGSISATDLRYGGVAGRIATVLEGEDAPAVTGTVVARRRVLVNEMGFFNIPIVLAPNSAVFFVATVAQQITQLSIEGYERNQGRYERA